MQRRVRRRKPPLSAHYLDGMPSVVRQSGLAQDEVYGRFLSG